MIHTMIHTMTHTKTLMCIALSCLMVFSGCSTPTPNKGSVADIDTTRGHDALKYGQSRQPTVFESDVHSRVTHLKTIAVTDISYSKEFRDAFYFEENKVKRSDQSTERKPPAAAMDEPKPPAPVLEEKAPTEKPGFSVQRKRNFDNQRALMHQVGFMRVQATPRDLPEPPAPPKLPNLPNLPNQPKSPDLLKPPTQGNSAENEASASNGLPAENSVQSEVQKSNNFEQTYTKKYGTERKINYAEIRGLSGPIKGMLIKSGYKVVQGKPNVERPDQNDDYFDIVKRIKAGDFEGADYVLYGVLSGLKQNTHSAPITGSSSSMAINELDIAIDFSLIDTKSFQVVASFLALGSATDNRIDGLAEGYQANYAKMMPYLSNNLAQNVAYHLGSQDFVTTVSGDASSGVRVIPGTDKFRFEERNFKVYK